MRRKRADPNYVRPPRVYVPYDLEYAKRYNKTPRARSLRRLAEAKRYAANPLVKTMSAAVRLSLRQGKSGAKWQTLVGYDVARLRAHLERQFVKGMTWENYGSRWHIDHIVPVSAFKFSSPQDPDFLACWALTNLRPLWKADNIKKNGKRTHLL